jgi:uncharacterized protein (TIGR03435 family)
LGVKRWIAAAVLSVLTVGGAHGQSEFEVASIKPSPPTDGRGFSVGCDGGPGSKDPGTISCQNVTLTMLVARAYNMSYDLVAAPDWMSQQKFDIVAKVPAGASKAKVEAMWQQLLTERFKLASHRESRVVARFDLQVAKGGPKFKESEEVPAPNDAAAAEAPRARGPNKLALDGFPELPRPGMIGMNGRIRLYDPKMTMDQLAKTCSGQLGKPVTQATGLMGQYEIRLYWVSESANDPAGPTLAQALKNQLGLQLEANRGPVEFLIVDHMEKLPTEN